MAGGPRVVLEALGRHFFQNVSRKGVIFNQNYIVGNSYVLIFISKIKESHILWAMNDTIAQVCE